MGTANDTRRRWIGAIFLAVALGMLILGQTLLRDRLRGVVLLVFWLMCLVCTCLAICVAFLDAAIARRRLRREQRALLDDTLKEIRRAKEAKSASAANRSQTENR